jgi:membrane associated rhomboid family serine protease
MKAESKLLWYCALMSLGLVSILWLVKYVEITTDTELYYLGIFPKTAMGLRGIITSHFIHSDWDHLRSNSISLLIVLPLMFYFYGRSTFAIVTLIALMNGIWVWSFARDSYHIGASGVIYGLVFFLFFAGVFSGSRSMKFISLLMVFVFGGILWGMLPFPNGVSWESHLMGGLAGIVCAFYFRKLGPQKEKYEWPVEEPETDEDDEYWKIPPVLPEGEIKPEESSQVQPPQPPPNIITFNYKYISREKNGDNREV